jgi:phenylacetate-CoA ligase
MIRATDVGLVAWQAVRHRQGARSEMTAFRDARLRRLIAHAYESVPYYRALLDRHGVRPDHVRTAADLARIPITTRRQLQTAPPESLLARGVDPARLIVHRTSGSSGEPLRVRRTWLEERLTSVFRLRALHEFGLRPTHRRARFVLPRPRDPHNWEGPQRIVRALGFHRKLMLDRRLPPSDLVARLAAIRPHAVTGTPGILVRLARALARERRGAVRPRLVVAGGDVLTPRLRMEIADGFGAPVFDMYGSYEMGTIAWECPRAGGFHVADDGVVLEVLRDGLPVEPGERGEVVVTQLHALAAPYIRYRLGDLAIRGETTCPCGAPFSSLVAVEGRVQDYLPLANGRLFLPTEIVALALEQATPWIAQHQVVQERTDHVVLRVVPLRPPPAGAVAALQAAVLERLGPGIRLDIALVPEIPLDASGKFQVARSRVETIY